MSRTWRDFDLTVSPTTIRPLQTLVPVQCSLFRNIWDSIILCCNVYCSSKDHKLLRTWHLFKLACQDNKRFYCNSVSEYAVRMFIAVIVLFLSSTSLSSCTEIWLKSVWSYTCQSVSPALIKHWNLQPSVTQVLHSISSPLPVFILGLHAFWNLCSHHSSILVSFYSHPLSVLHSPTAV